MNVKIDNNKNKNKKLLWTRDLGDVQIKKKATSDKP